MGRLPIPWSLAYPPQLKFELILSKLTVTTPAALVLRWAVSCATTCEPSVLVNVRLKVSCTQTACP